MIFLWRDVKCRWYVQTLIQAFIFHNNFICASNQNSPGLTIEKLISSGMCNFCFILAKNGRLKMRFVFCDFMRRDVKCRRYIEAFILHNIFTCASNQSPPGWTIEEVFSSWICNFWLDSSWKQTIGDEICVLWFFWDVMSSVADTLKILSFITFLFVLEIKIHQDWPLRSSFSVVCVIFILFKQKTDDWMWDLCFVNDLCVSRRTFRIFHLNVQTGSMWSSRPWVVQFDLWLQHWELLTWA